MKCAKEENHHGFGAQLVHFSQGMIVHAKEDGARISRKEAANG